MLGMASGILLAPGRHESLAAKCCHGELPWTSDLESDFGKCELRPFVNEAIAKWEQLEINIPT